MNLKDSEGSSHGLIKALWWYLPGGALEKSQKLE
jgi:hypothetical protein